MKDFSELPDGMPVDKVALEFEYLLGIAEGEHPPSDAEIADALFELTDRQWHTYQPLRHDLRLRVESWIRQHWHLNDAEYMDGVTSIITNLGLQSLMPDIRGALDGDIPEDTRRILQATLNETNGDVSNPFRGMPPRK